MTKIAVFGSRSLPGEATRTALLELLGRYGVTRIVTAGEPAGVCAEARALAPVLGVPLSLHYLDHSRRRAGAFEHRSLMTIAEADRAVLLHDGRSKGTANELALCVKRGLPHEYRRLAARAELPDEAPPADDWAGALG